MRVPYRHNDNLPFDFSVVYENDPLRMCMMIRDRFGFFLPVTYLEWNDTIARELFPAYKNKYPEWDPNVLFYYSVRSFCKLNEHLYIGQN